MEWSNEKIIEFLELFRMEPCLWDPRLKSHKKRSAQSDAWRRIMQSLSFQVTLEELKKKKESLMGYYRIHLNKYKKSLKSSIGTDDVYTTSWFAYDTLDSFLRPIYVTNSIMNTESTFEENSTEEIIYFKEVNENESVHDKIATEYSSSNESESSSNHPTIEKTKQSHFHYKKLRTPEIINAEKQMNEALGCIKAITRRKKEELDEYDYFAGMIASKIRKIENMDDREELMNSIQNMTFKFYMKNKHINSPT